MNLYGLKKIMSPVSYLIVANFWKLAVPLVGLGFHKDACVIRLYGSDVCVNEPLFINFAPLRLAFPEAFTHMLPLIAMELVAYCFCFSVDVMGSGKC